jgi:hypothetical protein
VLTRAHIAASRPPLWSLATVAVLLAELGLAAVIDAELVDR